MREDMFIRFTRFLLPFLFVLFTSSTIFCIAQESDKLTQYITDVTLKDVLYKQTFQGKNGSCIVSIKILNSDKQDEEEYEFNLSDLNEYKIDLKASKQSLKVECETKGSKNVIRVYENGKVKKYTDSFEFYANDVETGKLIVAELKEQVKLCSDAQNDLSSILGNSPDLNSAIEYLKANVKTVEVNGISKEQTFNVDNDYSALCTIDITDKTENENIKYSFNAADINLSSIDFETKNEFVFVTAQTKGKTKLIEVFENGEKENYTNSIDFFVEDIEESRKLKNALEFYVKESEKVKSEELKQLENLKSLNDFNDFFQNKLKNVSINDVSYSQSFSYDKSSPYLGNFMVVNENKGETETSIVNLIDINSNSMNFNTSGTGVKIEMETNGKSNLAKYSINGEPGKYTNKILLWSSGIEDARILVETLKNMVVQASEIYKPNFIEGVDNPTKEQCLSFLNQSFTEVIEGTDAYNVELKEDADNSCKLTYKEHDVTKDKTFEYLFDMNDVNVHKISFNARGEEALVNLETKGEKKYIEIFEQGTSKGYNNKIDLKVQDIEKARLITEALKKLSYHCAGDTK